MTRKVRIALKSLAVLLFISAAALFAKPKFEPRANDVRIAQLHQDVSGLATALDAFEVDCGRYPSTTEGLGALVMPPTGITKWRGPYFTPSIPLDPWGKPYRYVFPGTHNLRGFDLVSAGRDGKFGTPDDFDNWNSGSGNASKNTNVSLPPRTIGAIAAAVAAIIIIAILLPAKANGNGQSNPICLTCGYDLRATPRRCPECGTVPTGITGHSTSAVDTI